MAYEIIRKKCASVEVIRYLFNNEEDNSVTKIAKKVGVTWRNLWLCLKTLLKRKIIYAKDTGKKRGDKRIKIYHLTKKGERVYKLIRELEDLEESS